MRKGKIGSILVTGGGGFIGSHIVVKLLNRGYKIKIVDNFSNCKKNIIKKIKKISNKKFSFYNCDIKNTEKIIKIIKKDRIKLILHFASLKSVEESVKKPSLYFENNIIGTLKLLQAAKETNVKKFIFSSSACVYDIKNKIPYKENDKLKAANPYGQAKIAVEKFLKNLCLIDKSFSAVCLRYFNPIGAHKSGIIGEEGKKNSKNLIPIIGNVIKSKKNYLKIFGNNYKTKDGTCIRDYIHISDLVEGHLSAMKFIKKNKGWHAINLGTSKGHSVLEVVKSFENILGYKIKIKNVKRRIGDVPISVADVTKAKKILKWKAKYNLNQMCESFYKWRKLSTVK